MAKTKRTRKAHANKEEIILDSFESWLLLQKPKQVKAKTGFISEPAEKA